MSKHTPGPWTARTMNVLGHFEVKAEGYEVAEVLGRDIQNAQANACLIATAPELLEACKAAERWLSEGKLGLDRQIVEQLRKAIQKAED